MIWHRRMRMTAPMVIPTSIESEARYFAMQTGPLSGDDWNCNCEKTPLWWKGAS